MSLDHTFKVGDILTVATGEYSDFCYNGPFRVIREFNTKELGQVYLNQEPEYEEYPIVKYVYKNQPGLRYGRAERVETGEVGRRRTNEPSAYDFDGWLVKQGYVEAMESIEWHVGSCNFGD